MKANIKKMTPGRLLVLLAGVLLLSSAAGVFSLSNRISREIRSSSEESLREMLFVITQHTDQMFLRDALVLSRWAGVFEGMDAGQLRDALQLVGKDEQVVSLSFVPGGASRGLDNSGRAFDPAQYDFSGGRRVGGLDMSEPYMGSVGAWCYCLRTEVGGGTLYGEFTYDSLRKMIPQEFYSNNGVIYMMDAASGRFVVHPNNLAGTKGGNRSLKLFLAHNQVTDEAMLEQIYDGIACGDRMIIRLTLVGRPSYIYFWPTAEGRHYLVGYVPEDSITRLSDSVAVTIAFMVGLLAALFLILAAAYAAYYCYRRRIESERAREQAEHVRQVSEALELAQAASRSKSVFLSNMSHDIRTPMNAITGFSTLLMRDAGNPGKVREYTRKIASSSQHLLSLINDVLDMSRIESGKMVLNVREFDLAAVVAAVDTVIRPQAAAKGQTLEVSVSGLGAETLLGDETRINQVLINLLSNAVKYTQEGGRIDFLIRGFQTSDLFQGLEIAVRDNGYGMTPAYCEHIFDAFSRAENSTTNKVQGTGLGMAITKSTVELMGGTIHVDSTFGEGSTFTVRLELGIPPEAAGPSFWEAHSIRRMLVLDGDPESRRNIQGLMRDTGVQVDGGTPEDALPLSERAREEGYSYDVILLDWRDGAGAGTARLLRQVCPETPILALTASSWADAAGDGGPSGVNAFLQRPFFVANLKVQLTELQRSRIPAEAVVPNLLEGCRFLAAEDNELNAEILGELLSMQGAECDVVENGKLAVEAFQAAAPGTYAAILMDVQMPVMGGYEAARAIRALDRADAAAIPIVAMTANAFTEDVADALEAGMNAHVAKPVDTEVLNRTLAEITRRDHRPENGGKGVVQ